VQRAVGGVGQDVDECFAGAEHGEIVGWDGSGSGVVHEARPGEGNGCAAKEGAPAFLVFGGALSECNADGGVLGDLLGEVGIDSCEVGEALGGQDAHHAGFSRACQEWNDVASFAAEGGELVDDDEAGTGAERGDAHQVQEEPGADLGGQRGVGSRVEAEQDRATGLDSVFQGQAGAEAWAGDAFEDQAEAGSKAGDAFAFDLSESVDLAGQFGGLGSVLVAQESDELVGIQELEDALGCAWESGLVEGVEEPEEVAFGGGSVDVGFARVPLALDESVGDAGGVAA
jgi:hypothetical protein